MKLHRYILARILAVAVLSTIIIIITDTVVTAGRVDATSADAGLHMPALVDVHLAQIAFETCQLSK